MATKVAVLPVRLLEREYDLLRAAAARLEVPVSTLMRELAMVGARTVLRGGYTPADEACAYATGAVAERALEIEAQILEDRALLGE